MHKPPSMSAEELHTLLSTVPKPKSRPRSDYDRDDRESQVLLHTLDLALKKEDEERKKQSKEPNKP
jgi:hypothetical protein